MYKLNIFILEDSQDRIEYFKKQFEMHNLVIHTEITKDTYYTLEHNKFDILFLDHDLESHIIRREKSGKDVAMFLSGNKLQTKSVIYIHSMNPIGANNMLKILDKAGYEVQWIPFFLLKQSGGKI